MSNEIIAQPTQLVQVSPANFLIVEDGVHYAAAIDEWVTVIDGEITSYHRHQGLAWASYNEQLATYADHVTRNEYNAPGLFVAGPVDWEACPDCGRVYNVGDDCPLCTIPFDGRPMHDDGQGWGGAADYGLEARA